MVLMGSDYPLVSGGLKFIHGFSGILTTLWYHQTFLPSDEFDKKPEELSTCIASMQIMNECKSSRYQTVVRTPLKP
jgi:hypothetical protein